jgi:hypothetical protein
VSVDELDSYTPQDEQLWYVAHPIRPTEGEVAAWVKRLTSPIPSMVRMAPDLDPARLAILDNIANAKGWLAWLIWRYPAVTFIAPYVATLDGGGDDDLDPAQRARGLRDCRRTVRVCNGIVLVGGRLSGGMLDEASVARAAIDLTFLGRTPPPYNRKEPP